MNPRDLRLRDLRRLVGGLWTDARCDAIAPAVLDAAVAVDAKSCDRAVLSAYLRHFPSDHPAFERLRAAASLTAQRRDWPWRARGERWRLWDRDAGPATIAAALLASDDPAAVLREAGLDGDLAQGEFVAEAVETACDQAGAAKGTRAVELGQRLIALFQRLVVADLDAELVDALMTPWTSVRPDKDYMAPLSGFLTARFGDPRFEGTQWARVEADMLALRRGSDPRRLTNLLRGWLTEATVRAFFNIVRTTTDRKDQWDAREAFWLAYMDSGAITEAWFAFGRRAELLAGRLAKEDNVRFARVSGGADPSHSALILSIGDLRIAEWSHNGSCRFWPHPHASHADSRLSRVKAPMLYQDNYDGTLLRTTFGPKGFEFMSHTSGWQAKAANIIFRHTGHRHPRWGGH
ncbi:EH signature domain-containing protein [Sphingomonas sp.]|uniref:EH signature domain-containing protein n=1 Tax=Sphingomonas sp. TaxID=28214 RepID=UPI0035BC8E09